MSTGTQTKSQERRSMTPAKEQQVSEAKHSAAPWNLVLAKFGGDYVQGFSVTPAGKRVAIACVAIAEEPIVAVLAPHYRHTAFAHEHYTPEELEANARLISAAPDLLKQLKSVLACIEVAGSCYGGMDAIRSAIASAEGRSRAALALGPGGAHE